MMTRMALARRCSTMAGISADEAARHYKMGDIVEAAFDGARFHRKLPADLRYSAVLNYRTIRPGGVGLRCTIGDSTYMLAGRRAPLARTEAGRFAARAGRTSDGTATNNISCSR